MTFNVNDRVVLVAASNLKTHNEYDDDETERGTVRSVLPDGMLSVKWDNSWRKPNPSNHQSEELILETEADQILSKLEAEYEAWAGPIKEKMVQAGALLREAGKLASARNREITEMNEAVRPLLNAMRSLGWSTSSLSC